MYDDNSYRHPWIGVELRHLAALTAVARTGSFRHAARELGYVQSAVSQQIARLERVVGSRLIEREKGQRHVGLTRTGEVLAQRGERILGELNAARIALSHADDDAERAIRLAIPSDLAPLLATLFSSLGDSPPGSPVQVIEVPDDAELARLIEHGTADVAIGVPLAAPGLASVTLLQDPFVILVRPDSPLVNVARVSSVRDLGSERLIVPSSVPLYAPLHAPGLPLEGALRVPLAVAVPPLVAEGHGVGLVPRTVADHLVADGELAVVSTVGLIAPQRVMLAWRAAGRRSARLAAFCDMTLSSCLDAEPPARQIHAA